MSCSADGVVVLPEPLQADLVESRHLDRDQLSYPLSRRGISEDRSGKTTMRCCTVNLCKILVEQRVASCESYGTGNIFALTEYAEVIEDADRLDRVA